MYAPKSPVGYTQNSSAHTFSIKTGAWKVLFFPFDVLHCTAIGAKGHIFFSLTLLLHILPRAVFWSQDTRIHHGRPPTPPIQVAVMQPPRRQASEARQQALCATPHPHIRPPCTIFHQCILAFRLLCLPSENSAQHTSDSISSRPVSQLGPQRLGQRHPCRFQPAFAISELSNQCKRLYRATIIDFAAKPVSLQCQSCSWALCRDVPPPV